MFPPLAEGLVPWARIGEAVGHDDIATTNRSNTHILVDEQEVDYCELMRSSAAGDAPDGREIVEESGRQLVEGGQGRA